MMFLGAATFAFAREPIVFDASFASRCRDLHCDKVWVKVHGPLFSLCESTDQLFHQSVHGEEGVLNLRVNFEHQP